MVAGAVIPASRTASPAEFDDLLASTEKLSDALGPNGVNRTGALSDALHTAAANLNGNGQNINTTLGNLSKAVTTLSANRGNLAGTVTNLQRFTGTIKDDDGQVRAFTEQFAQVSGYLSDERKDLGETLRELADTLDEVRDFVKDNRSDLRRNVDQLSDVLRTVNHEKLSLDQTLTTAPMGLDGLVNSYDAASGTLHTRPALIPTILCALFGLFPAALQSALLPVLGPLLNAIIPGGVASCPTLASTPLFDQINAYINSLLNGTAPAGTTPSLLPGVTGLLNNSAQSLTALPQGSSTPAAKSHPEKLEQPRPRPSLGQLLGGGL
jgi:ABC-type transporter Mla subunit MlaD